MKLLRKSQMEIMGLAIIVLLVSLGILFGFQFFSTKPKIDSRKAYTHSEVASNLLNAMLKISSGCKKTTLTELYQDCAKHKSYGALQCNATHNSCMFINSTVKNILNLTLNEWKKDYNFSAMIGSEVLTKYQTGSCKKEKQTKIYPIPLHPGTLVIKLEICE